MNLLLNKVNLNEIAKELNNAVINYDYLCLLKTHKWCTEMLYSLENINIPEENMIINNYKIFDKDYRLYQLARSYFNLKEYQRSIFYLNKSDSQICVYLASYAKYMSILKKCVDNRSDIFDNPDSSSLESLQNLRNDLKQRYFKSQLDAYTLYVYGIVLMKLKLNDEAVLILLEAINKQPTLWCAWTELANLIKSVDMLNNLSHSALPQHWIKDLFLAHSYMELSLSEEALNIYQEYCNRGFLNCIYIKSQIARCYDNIREGSESKATFEAIRKLDPYNLDYMDTYSNILFVLEEHAQLAILAQEASEIDKYRPESCCIIGNYYSLQNDHHKAVTYFQRALKLNPAYLQAWTLMGHEFMELKNSSAAIQSYTHAIEFNPRDYRAWYGIGQTYEILKLYSYSLYYYKQVYMMRPNDSRFIVALGDVYVKLEKLDEARRCYIKAYSVGDCEGTALCKLAKVYEKLNDPANSAVAYEKYTQDVKMMECNGSNTQSMSSDLSQAYRYLANYYFKKSQLDQAYEAASKCLEFSETRLEAQSLLSQIAQSRTIKEQQELQANATDMDIGGSINDSQFKAKEEKLHVGIYMDADAQSAHNFSDTSNASLGNRVQPKALNTKTDSDSESDTVLSDFHIKRFSSRKDM